MAIYAGLTYHMVKGTRREFHWHPELEALFAVEGRSTVTIREASFAMKQGDVLVVNSGMSHRVISEEDGILCCVHFPWKLLEELVGEGSRIFFCNSTVDTQRSYQQLQERFRSLVYEYVSPSLKSLCRQDILLLEILDLLIEEYQIEALPPKGVRVSDDLRIQQIVQYVNRNFQQNLSLSALAEELYLSPSALSRFFKKQTGIYFVDYVNQVRARFGLVELIYSDASITEIAVNSGFSNLSVFSRVFKGIYGMTPTEYRRENRQRIDEERRENESLRSELAQRYPGRAAVRSAQGSIVADVSTGERYERRWNQCINIGFLDHLTQNNLRAHTLMLCQTLGFSYVRVWNVFSRRLMLTDGVHGGNYNYGRLDEALDFLVNNHIRPWLDLSARPYAAVMGEGKVIFLKDSYIDFRSRTLWEAMVVDFLRHVVKRYGQEEVNGWIFELCSDRIHPDSARLYREAEPDVSFFEDYHFVWRMVRRYAPQAQMGGPGMVPDYDRAFNRRFLEQCVEEGCVPDFLSFLLFPYVEEEQEQERTVSRHRGSRNAELEQVRSMRELMRETGTGDCRLYACEWNNSLSNRDYLNDCCYRSAYIVRTVNLLWEEGLDLACIRLGSDIVGSYYDTYRVANGNGGLLTINGVRKPAYFAFQFLHALGDYLVDRGDGYLITRTAHGRLFLLFYNYKWFGSSFFLRREEESSPEELPGLFENQEPQELEVTLKGLGNHTTYFVNRQVISCSEGSLLHEWSRFQYEESPESREYLKAACFPRMSMVRRSVTNGRLVIRETLQANEVSLLYIFADN